MKSKDRIIIQKIIGYIENYIYGIQARDFLDDKKTITACAFTVSQIGELVKEITNETINKYKSIPWNSIKVCEIESFMITKMLIYLFYGEPLKKVYLI